MSEKKEKSKLSLSAKADKFDVPLGTLKKVYKRGVAAWNSGHRPGTTPQQWGHARVNSFLRKGKTYHTADKDLREDAEQLNELDIQTYNKYIEATYSQTPAAQARKLGGPKHAQRTLGRLRARKLKQKQIDKPENQAKLAQIRAEHEALHNPNKDPSGRGYGEGRYMGDHVEHDPDINKLFERAIENDNPLKNKGLGIDPEKFNKDPNEQKPGERRLFVPASPEKRASAEALKKQGKSDRDIWDTTGVYNNPISGEYEEEIDDSEFSFTGVSQGKASDVLRHDKLLQRVPDAFDNMNVNVTNLDPQESKRRQEQGSMTMGGYTPAWMSRQGPKPAELSLTGSKDENKKTGVHELQHRINSMYGRSKLKGTSTSEIKSQTPGIDDYAAYDRYFKSKGEAHARLAGNRTHLDSQQRKRRFPGDDLDVNPAEYQREHVNKLFERLIFVPANEYEIAAADEIRQNATSDMSPDQIEREVWKKTGVWVTPGGKSVTEIPDNEATYTPGSGSAKNLISHEKLTKRFPRFFDNMTANIGTPLSADDYNKKVNSPSGFEQGSLSPGRFDGKNNRYTPPHITLSGTASSLANVGAHELQHAVSDVLRVPGFEGGVAASDSQEDFDAYWKNRGEELARLTGIRRILDQQQRRDRFPSDDLPKANDKKLAVQPERDDTPHGGQVKTAPPPAKPTPKAPAPASSPPPAPPPARAPAKPNPPSPPTGSGSDVASDFLKRLRQLQQQRQNINERLLFLDADPEQASAASELERSGKSPEQIWKEKGAFKDPYTGKWTKEISDKQMDLPGFQPQSGFVKSDKKAQTKPAQAAIKHDELFRQVPGVKATQVTTQSITPVERIFGNLPYRGQYSGPDLRRGYRPPSIHTLTTSKKGALDVMAHELQHNVDALQRRFNTPKYDAATFNQSKLTNIMRHSVDPNEIRANATMSRRELDDAQRRERFPLKDYKLGASVFGGKFGVPLTWVPQSLRESQLVGTDEYRDYALAMTPGQEQEIQDAFPPEVYGTEVYEPTTQEESTNTESNGSVEYGVDSTSGNSFRAIRKKLQEQEVEELEDEEQIEGEEEEEEGENDGAEDGVDFTPNLKTTKARRYVPQVSAADSVSGFPVLGIAEGLFDKLKAVKKPTSPPRPPVSRTSNILRNVSRNAGRISTGAAVAGAGAKAAAGDYSGAATDAAVQAGQSAAAKLATKKAATMTAKFVSKAAARKLPLGLGLAATGAGVADRLRSRDYLGAAGEGLSGLAGTLPGVGTAVSAGIDTALLGRDLKNLRAQTQQKKKPTLAEAVEYHQDNNISLIENAFRPGSEMFFAMILEAKRQYTEGEYTPQDEFEQDLLESDIGEVAEYDGETVLLDFPYEEIDEELDEECWDGYEQKGMKKKGKKMVPNCVPVNEEGDPTHGKGIGKPFRSRGGGAVYVKNEKGNVIKVNFSQSGMRKRFNEPARVKSFVARHNCYGNKDRTSASYWACRWPRYFSDTGQQWW